MITDTAVGRPRQFADANGGIIGRRQQLAKPDSTPKMEGYEAERISMDPTADTVEGRIDSILAKDSPLMKRAETQALQNMNKRGLANSSMAIGSAQNAVIDNAFRIGSQDADASLRVKGANQAAGNTASQFNAGETNNARLAERGYQAQQDNIAAQGDQNIRQTREQGEQTRQTQQEAGDIESRQIRESSIARRLEAGHQGRIDRENMNLELQNLMTRDAALQEDAVELAEINRRHDQLLQTNQSAALFYSQQAAAISQILSQPELTPTEKSALIRQQNQLLESGLTVMGSIANLDLTGLLDFGTGTGTGAGVDDNAVPGYRWNDSRR